ncbi:MAG: hypothetical protein HYY04_11115 [Chloroflexi bacterium]|nr:hypothetical protein [Chloroflexota bacterium]
MERHRVTIDGRTYRVDVVRRKPSGPDAVSIVQPCHNGRVLTQASIEYVRIQAVK